MSPALLWPIITAVMSAVSTGASLYAQAEAMEAQNEAITANLEQEYLQLQEEEEQANDEAALKKFEARREAMRQKAIARAQGAESGALGNSFSRTLAEVDIDEMINIGGIEAERQNTEDAVDLGMDAAQIEAEHSYGSMSGELAGLQIITSGASAGVGTGITTGAIG